MSIQKIKNHYSSVDSYLVSAVFSSRTVYTEKKFTSTWVMLCRGMNRFMSEASELITEKAVETIEPFSTEWRQSRIEKARAEGSNCHEEQVCYTKSTIAIREREREKKTWEIVLEFEGPHPPLQTAISKFVMKMLRHCDQEERESDGSKHRDSVHVNFFEKFDSKMGQKLHTGDWRQAIYKGSNKTWFQ